MPAATIAARMGQVVGLVEILRAVWPYLRPHRRMLIWAGLAMIGETVTALLAPWPLKYVVDRVIVVGQSHGGGHLRLVMGRAQWTLLGVVALVAVGIAAVDALLTYFDAQLSEVAAQKAVYELRRSVFSHLQRLSVSFHQATETRVGDLLSRLSGDIGALQDLAASGVSNLVTNGLTLVAMASVLLWMDWPMGLAAVAFTVPTALYTRRNTKVMRQAMRTARRQEGRVSAVLQESLSHVKLMQAYGREELEHRRLTAESDRSLEANIAAATLLARLTPSVSFMSAVAYALLIAIGTTRVVGGHITPGELLVFLAYARSTQSPIRQLAKLSYRVSRAGASMERLREVLMMEPSVLDRPGAAELEVEQAQRVSFREVSFSYSPGRKVLDRVSLEAGPGQLVAVVGHTGSGKSTLMSLLPRFYDPVEGQVLIDGRDVRDFTLESLRRNIALVLQDSLIFRTTILDNVAYGRPDATRSEIIEAADAAGVGLVAARLEDGYDTVVSERGASLSGGEKQCIGVARAMLKNAAIVVLDEPTSSMDAETERLVMTGVARLLEGRTGFMIAHRLSTVLRADQVVVMEGGRVAEVGLPADLLADEGSIFARLARSQHLRADAADLAVRP